MSNARAAMDRHIEAAAFWDARLRHPDCPAADRDEFEAWRNADAANAQAFQVLQDMLSALRGAASLPPLRDIGRPARRGRRDGFAWAAGVAAVIILAVGGDLVLRYGETLWRIAAALGVERLEDRPTQIYATEVGERRTVTLADGSSVTLNTQSRIDTHFTRDRRDVTLVAGQALFKVAHDAAHPFVVAVGDRSVTAVGTQFDVRLDRREMQVVHVVLVEGRVAVERRLEKGLAPFGSSDRRVLSPGEMLEATGSATAMVRRADVDMATLWQEGRVAFVDTPLPDAVAEMNRYSREAIIVSVPTMAKLRVNGVFSTSEPQAFIDALEAYFPIEARKQPGGGRRLVWRR